MPQKQTIVDKGQHLGKDTTNIMAKGDIELSSFSFCHKVLINHQKVLEHVCMVEIQMTLNAWRLHCSQISQRMFQENSLNPFLYTDVF